MDNQIKEIISSIPDIHKIHEIIDGKFYFAITSRQGIETCLNIKSDKIIFYCAHNNLHYQGFIFDFGPYNLAQQWKYCMQIKKFLKLAKEQNKILIQISSIEGEKLVNSAFLCGCYSILYLNYEPTDIYNILSDNNKTSFIGYRDASVAPSPYKLSLIDCFKAIKKANKLKFIDLDNFNVHEYCHYEKVKNGDINWIIPNKLLAFSGPHNKTAYVNNYPQFEPSFYFDYFRKRNVTTIIRLNEKRYDERKFTDYGFVHKDLFFRDGTSPNLEILNEFLSICENADGCVAIHCKAGLGRTGTLIACYLIKHYQFTAHEAIAWTRMCRPGSVIANQQIFLVKNEPYLLFKGQLYDIQHSNEISFDDPPTSKCEFEREIDFDDDKPENKKELNSKVKKITCKLRMFNLQLTDRQNDLIENNDKDTQGDILNKLKWTRSKSKIAQLDQHNQEKLTEKVRSSLIKSNKNLKNLDVVSKVLDCDEQANGLRLTDKSKNSPISIKKLIQHYNSKFSENDRDNFQMKKIATDHRIRTRSFTSLLNRSKIHGSNPITKPNLMNNNTLIADKLIKSSSSNLKNNKANVLGEKTRQSSRTKYWKISVSKSETK